MTTLNVGGIGVSPGFAITGEEFLLHLLQGVTRITIDGVEPPTQGAGGGYSVALQLYNFWFPWVDEKIVESKFDGVCQQLGTMSNRPTYVRDYHMIALMRAVDYILAPRYWGQIVATADSVVPVPPNVP